MIIPVMPFYMKNLGAGGKELGWLTAIYALTQVGQHSPKWGAQCLCQRIYGREPAKFFATRSEVFHVKRMLQEISERLLTGGAISHLDDIYWLTKTELETLITQLDKNINMLLWIQKLE